MTRKWGDRVKVELLKEVSINNSSIVSVKKMNHIYELCYLQHRNQQPHIQLLDKDNYVLLSTGEVKECKHIDNRSENKLQVSQSLKRLRDYINTNVEDVKKCKWITLTYKENMTDTKRLYVDFKNFVKRFKYKYGHFEYIVACEPQGRGAWHLHCIIIFKNNAPYIPNNVIWSLWSPEGYKDKLNGGKGYDYVKTQKLDDIDNIGAYLTAYLGDLDLSSCIENNIEYREEDIKLITEIGNIKLKKPKRFVKGGRLSMYPPKFNIYRISRGIKKPTKEYFIYHEIKEKAGLGNPTYSKSILLTDDEKNFSSKITYEYYNTKRQ